MSDSEAPFGTIKFRKPTLNATITFSNQEGEIGKLDFNQSPATFKGDVDTSAQQFFDALIEKWAATGIDELRAERDSLKAKLEEAEDQIKREGRMIAAQNALNQDRMLTEAALTARVEALEKVLGKAEIRLGDLSGFGFTDQTAALRSEINAVFYSTPAADLEAHDARIKRDVVEKIIEGLCFCHGELWPAGVRHGTGRPCPPWGEEEECGPPAGFTDRDKDAFYRAAGIPPSTDTPTQEPK